MMRTRFGSLSMVVAATGTGVGLARLAPVLDPTALPSDPELALTIAVWWGAVILTLWWTTGVVLWAVSRRSARPVLVRLARLVTLRSSRRAAEALLTLSLMGAGCSIDGDERAPAMRLIGPAESVTTTELVPPTTRTTTTAVTSSTTAFATASTTITSTTSTRPPATVPPTLATPRPEPSSPEHTDAAARETVTSHVVVSGDNLWAIAEATLTARTTEPPSLAAVTAYWAELVDHNRNRLRSGDPNLIHPGEIIELPAVA